jgi:hypothetical protein
MTPPSYIRYRRTTILPRTGEENEIVRTAFTFECRTVFVAATFVASCYASQANGDAAPPEVARTVAAFVGRWTLDVTDTEPGAAPAHFPLTLECRRTALGAAVACDITADVPDAGPIEASLVVGYSPDERQVRWMEISSTREYHDHHGVWRGDAIEFEQLRYTVDGAQATEHLKVEFPTTGRIHLIAVTDFPSGPRRSMP